MNHESWMDESQGKVPHGRGITNTDKIMREHYTAPHAWEHQLTGTPITEADREQMREWQIERNLINQMGEENLCSMN